MSGFKTHSSGPASESDKLELGGPVLLVEDNPIVALDCEDNLLELGATEVVLAIDVAQGLAALEKQDFVVAVLDVGLGDDRCTPVADACTARGIPFVFATGYGDLSNTVGPYLNTPVVVKPYDVDGLRRSLFKALGGL